MASPLLTQSARRTPSRVTVALWAVMIGFVALSLWRFWGSHSPDLWATWLAGHFFGSGALDQVYPADDTVYTMHPPGEWWPYLQARGWDKSVFPYVYPPLWAALSSWITPVVSMEMFKTIASVLNPALMAGMVCLAGRASGLHALDLLKFCSLGLTALWVTLPGSVALEQNQPQILVSFLLVAAIERDRADAPRTAGALLALAAAIKLYPAVLAVIWLAGRRWSALRAFAVMGAALAGLSVLLAGWPLHQAFLHEVGAIKNSVLVTAFTYGIDSTLAQFVDPDRLIFVAGLDNEATADTLAGWAVLSKGALWSNLSSLALLGVLIAAARRARSQPAPVTLWPATIVGVALFSPLSWGYHYLPALAFAPALLWLMPIRKAALLLLAIFAPISIAALDPLLALPTPLLVPQIAGSAAMILLGIAFWMTPRPGRG